MKFYAAATYAMSQLEELSDPDSTSAGPNITTAQSDQIQAALNLIGWGAAVGAVFVLAIIGLKIMTARAGHSPENAANALGSLPWVFGGLLLVYSAKTIVVAVL